MVVVVVVVGEAGGEEGEVDFDQNELIYSGYTNSWKWHCPLLISTDRKHFAIRLGTPIGGDAAMGG